MTVNEDIRHTESFPSGYPSSRWRHSYFV